jgi:transcriptional regulator with XRE-family HTH domain
MKMNFSNTEVFREEGGNHMVYERINAAVSKSGIKQKVIAERIGVSEQALSAMLSGRRKISVDEFFGLCIVLNVTPDDLYGFDSVRKTKAV